VQDSTTNVHQGLKNTTVADLPNSVKDLKMACTSDNASDVSHRSACKGGVLEPLVNYWESLLNAHQSYQVQASEKGKEVVGDNVFRAAQALEPEGVAPAKKEVWKPPSEGWATVHTDAGFCKQSGIAGTGIVIRYHAGKV
jgi:hypothetical protein